jgi:hypothetical protein
MKIPTWVWLLGAAGLAYWAYTYFYAGGGPVLGAALSTIDTNNTGGIVVGIAVNNNSGAAIQVSGLSVAATYSGGSIGTGTWSGTLPVGTSTISVTIPAQAAVQSDLFSVIENGNSGDTIQLYGTSPTVSFNVNATIP